MDRGLPTGTVTLLLADVERSTRAWEAEPAVMAEAVARLHVVVTDLVARHAGARPVEQGEGDSFVAGFARASDALGCALDLQRADLEPLRLRVGVHTDEIQLRDDGNYMGPAMNRAARLRELAHGGQTVLSGSTADLVAGRLPEGAWLIDLGTHRLRDLARPERVHQLCAPGLRAEFPPLRSLDAFAHNLPVQLTSFVGREAEMAEVVQLLGGNRFLTLVGAGGVGKTRLALQAAAELMPDHPEGVWHADLSALADPVLTAGSVAEAMGFPDEVGRTPAETVVRHVGGGRVLVVLDNCEHLVASCAALVESLLRGCDRLVVLATSREPLGVEGEVTYRLPSLSTHAAGGEAVQLFADRARRARPSFVVTDANMRQVTGICRQLGGIPLAIVLAAARVRAFSLDQIAAGLEHRFSFLTGGARSALPRQQTLRASVDWSWNLLTEPEQVLFRRLAVFAGASTSTPPPPSAAARESRPSRSSTCSPRWLTSPWSSPTTVVMGTASDYQRRSASTRMSDSTTRAKRT